MVRKFTSLNNGLAKRIISYACNGNKVLTVTSLLSHYSEFDEPTFHRLFNLVFDLCPIGFNDFIKLHPQYRCAYVNFLNKYIITDSYEKEDK